jgi:Spy/CpxP family protein refolding chaperone
MQAVQRITNGERAVSMRGVVAALVLGVGLASSPALAQPEGHGRHGHHGHHGHRGDHFLANLGAAKAQLNLDASQQALWDSAAAAGKAARETSRARRATIRQVVAEEAAKTTPDLVRIATTTDTVQDSNTTDRRAARDQWLKLYSTFRSDQVAVVKQMLANRMTRMDNFGERMKRRFGRD